MSGSQRRGIVWIQCFLGGMVIVVLRSVEAQRSAISIFQWGRCRVEEPWFVGRGSEWSKSCPTEGIAGVRETTRGRRETGGCSG